LIDRVKKEEEVTEVGKVEKI